MRTRRTAVIASALVFSLALLASASVAFGAEKGDMRGQVGVLWSSPTGDLVEPGETIEADSAFGVQLSFEYLLTDLIGIEPGLGWATHDVNVKPDGAMLPEEELGEIDYLALTANLNFHILGGESLDFFVGPTVGYVFWGDLESDLFMTSFPTDDEFVYGANVGLDVPLGERWGLQFSLVYLVSDIVLQDSSDDLGFDPIQAEAGVSFRF